METLISWVSICVLFLERLKKEKVGWYLMPEQKSAHTSALTRAVATREGGVGREHAGDPGPIGTA